jgi:alpha-1,6-mannosyltransferase
MAIKTLHLTNFYHPTSGGIRTFYQALLKAANEHRRLVRLVVPGPENSVEEVGEFGRIYHVAAPRSPVIDSRYRVMLPHTYAWPHESELRRILAVERPDLVEVCDKFMLCYLPGVLRHEWIGVPVPVFVGLTCERLDDNMAAFLSESRFAEWLCEFYMRRCYVPRFDFQLAVSDYIASEVRRVLPERMAGRLYVAPMGVECELFSSAHPDVEIRRRLLAQSGGNDSTRLLLYAGRLSKEKNLLLLPEVLAKLAEPGGPEYRLVVAGDGPFRDELCEALGRTAPGRSLFLGQQKRDELAALFQAVDVFVHPNPREPFGIGPLEAMAAGLPLVAPASGGLLTYANEGNAWLAEDSAQSFANAIRGVHADTAQRANRCASARRTAESLSWSNVTANYFLLNEHFHERFVSERLLDSSSSLSRPPSADAAGVRLSL